MRLVRIFFAAATTAAIAAACSSFDEPPATPSDGDAGDASGDTGNVSNDGATSNDGGGEVDATTDVVTDGGACMPQPSCDGGIRTMLDFANEAVPVGFATDDLDNGEIAHVLKPGPCSGTDGFFRSTTTIPDADTSGTAYMSKAFTGSFGSAHLAFAFRGPKPVANGYANIGCTLILRGATLNPRTVLRLTLAADKLRYGATVRSADGGIVSNPDIDLDQAFTAASSEWRKLDVGVVITSNQVTMTTTYAGMTFGVLSAALLAQASRIDIECGIDYSEKAGASYVHDLDDVFLELCPSQ